MPEQKQKPKPKEQKVKADIPVTGFLCVLMLLSFVMISMYNVGMRLKQLGLKWTELWGALVELPECNVYARLKLYWWPPPNVQATKHAETRIWKKLFLTALAIAIMKADAAAPDIHFSSASGLNRVVQ